MAFRFSTFAGVTLPEYNWTADLSTPMTRNPIAETINGYIDFYGKRRRIDCSQEFELDGVPNPTSVAAAISALKALNGRWGELIRVDADGSNTRVRYCRLLWVGLRTKATDRGIRNMLTMRFYTNEPFWKSTATTTHGPTAIVSGGQLGLTISGQENVLDAVLSITATSNIASITVIHTKTENGITITSRITKSTQLNNGSTWVLDTGLYTAKVSGVDDLSSFALHSQHDEVFWLRIPAAVDTLTVTSSFTITLGSGSGTYTLAYQPAYP